jgi:rubrerythrin
MSETTKQVLEILRKAILAERNFQKEYALGANLAQDPEIRETFLKLVDDEMEHERILLGRYQQLGGELLDLPPEEE